MLTWSSIGTELEDAMSRAGRRLRLVICPFIQLPALRRLLDSTVQPGDLQVITRWNAADLVSGVSDIEVFPYLSARQVPLYVHKTIHLKLYIFDDGSAFLGSGNLSQAGLGWGARPSIEAGCFVQLDSEDWVQIDRVLRESIRVDEATYRSASAFIGEHKIENPPLPRFEPPATTTGGFSLLDLPATESPEALLESLQAMRDQGLWGAELAHDLQLLRVDFALAGGLNAATVLQGYRQLTIVRALVGWLSESGSRSFGEVTQWLHSNITDRPMPYRSDIKTAVSNLYRWLPLAFDEVTTGRPRHSEVLYFAKAE
jgi:hypothetical protein